MHYRLCVVLLCLLGMSCSAGLKDTSPTGHSEAIESPGKAGSRLPRLRTLPNGDVLMSWVEPKGEGHALKYGVLHNGRWVKLGEAAQGANWFVNWADYPSVVAIDEKFWVAHWLAKQSGGKTYDYDVALAISNDAGATWREIGHPHRDGTAAEHGFATIFADANAAGIIWLDGREHVKKEDKTKHPEKSGNFNLRYTHINRDGSMTAEQVLDSNTCTCCSTSVAVTPQGPVAAWRGRTDSEIRDNQVALLRDGKWTSPQPLGAEGWKIEGCPVNGPSISARGNQVVASWFTAEGEHPRVRAAFSKDGGATFGAPIEIDQSAPLGRIGVIWRDDNSAVVSWLGAPNAEQKIANLYVKVIYADGHDEPVVQIVNMSGGRDAGVPQMAATKDSIVFAWTNSAPQHGISIKTLSFAQLNADSKSAHFAQPFNKWLVAEKNTSFIGAICTVKH
ncbi:MAG: hypothetical protein WBC07_11645 [Methylotenera sp.]